MVGGKLVCQQGGGRSLDRGGELLLVRCWRKLRQKKSASLYLAEETGGDRGEKPSFLAGMAGEGSLHLRASALREKVRSLRNSYLCATCALLLV